MFTACKETEDKIQNFKNMPLKILCYKDLRTVGHLRFSAVRKSIVVIWVATLCGLGLAGGYEHFRGM